MLFWEKLSPSHVPRRGFASNMRLTCAIGATAGFLYFYECSICTMAVITSNSGLAEHRAVRFYGVDENKREVEMDMREMVDKVKRNEPLYGKSSLTPYMQGVASRNSRYSGIFLHVIPWFNFVNHDQVLHSVWPATLESLILCSTALTQPSTTDRQRGSLRHNKQAAHRN